MADFRFNRAAGRIVEFAERVNANDPANSVFVVLVLASSGLESDAVLKDKDTLADVLSGTTNEVTNTNYVRKTYANGTLTITYDDTNDRVDIDFADPVWTTPLAGDGWAKLLVCYDPDSAGGTDADIRPLTAHDFPRTPSGINITATLDSSGFFRSA